MDYIVYDLEFNQDFSIESYRKTRRPCFEIIQIGAVKLDQEMKETGSFQRYVKPAIYPEVNPFVTELTGITTQQLEAEAPFSEVYNDFAAFSGGSESVFCVWGTADLKELFRNIEYHQLDEKLMSRRYINLQPYAALHFNLSRKKLLKLKTAVELLGIPLGCSFHDALHDAQYTAEIFKKLDRESIRPKRYDYERTQDRFRQKKPKVDFEKLVRQFEKMYSRELTAEEQAMIKLSYQMGKTRQFLI